MNSSNEYKPVLFWSLLGAAFVLGLFYVRGQMLMRAAGQEGVVPAGSAPQALFMVYVLAAGCMALLLLAAAVLYRSRRFPPRAAVAASEEDINKTIKELHAEISGRKKVEQALRESEEQKQLIINNILDVVVQISTKGIIQYVSPSVKTLHGYDPERLKGKPMTFATPYEEIPRAWGVLRRVLRGEEVKDFVIKQRDISGAIRVKEIHLSPIKKEGKVVGAQGIMRDISERIKLEERLSEQKVYLEKVIDALQHPFYVIDADDYTIKLANSAARRFGLSDHSTCYELTHRRSKPCEGDHFCPLAQVKETKQPVTVEHTHFDEQGRPRIIEVHGYPLMDNHGRVKAMIEYGIDITERRRVDEEIKKAAVEWQLTFDSIPDAVSIQDRELRLLRINKAFAELLQRSPEQMIGKVCHSLVHDSDSPHDFCPCQKTFSTGEATQQEIYEPKLNSYLEIDTSPIRSEEGEVVKCVHVIKNITDRKLSEQALRDSEEKYRSLVDNIGIGVALISRDMRILTLNKRMHEWFPHVNVNETPVCYRAFRTYSPGEECPDCPTQKTFLDGKIHELIDSRPVNGRMVTFRIVSTAVKDRSGHIVAAIEMVEDITERQHAEKRIRDYTHRIELINRELDDFTYIVSHDLKEPLRSIDAFTKFIIDDNKELINDEGKLYLDRIRVNASRMQRLIDDLLELSRLERTTNPFSPVPLEEIIKDVQFRLEIAIREKSAQIVTRGTLPVIPCDRVRLTEVFANLISNAIKFTDGKQPLIEIGAEEKPDVYRVYVKDNGPGIEKKYQEKIFALFQRLTKTQDIAGTGAGLAIVKKIVQLHGGEIWVESAPGQGSSFFFTLAKKQNNGGGKEYVRGEEISKDTSGRGSG